MIRTPLASASLLAIAIALAGCGEGKDDKTAAPQAQAPAAARQAPKVHAWVTMRGSGERAASINAATSPRKITTGTKRWSKPWAASVSWTARWWAAKTAR